MNQYFESKCQNEGYLSCKNKKKNSLASQKKILLEKTLLVVKIKKIKIIKKLFAKIVDICLVLINLKLNKSCKKKDTMIVITRKEN